MSQTVTPISLRRRVIVVFIIATIISLLIFIVYAVASFFSDSQRGSEIYGTLPTLMSSGECLPGNWIFVPQDTIVFSTNIDAKDYWVAKFTRNVLVRWVEDVTAKGSNANGIFTYHWYRINAADVRGIDQTGSLWVAEPYGIKPMQCVPKLHEQ